VCFWRVLLISVRDPPVRFFRFGATQHQIMVVSNGKTKYLRPRETKESES
jgi:hypothetical protein